MAMGHVIFKEFHLESPSDPYFTDYVKRYSDMPFLVRLDPRGDGFVPGRMLRASAISKGPSAKSNNPGMEAGDRL